MLSTSASRNFKTLKMKGMCFFEMSETSYLPNNVVLLVVWTEPSTIAPWKVKDLRNCICLEIQKKCPQQMLRVKTSDVWGRGDIVLTVVIYSRGAP